MTYTDLKNEICTTWVQLSAEQMAQVRMALLEVSRSVGQYPRMREISKCYDLSSALILLEKWKLLTPQKVDILLWLTKDVGPHSEMIRGLIEQYKKISISSVNTHRSQERHDDQNRLPHEPIYAKICEYLSENLRGRWSDLGRSLNLGNLVSELFRESGIRNKDKIHQVLEEHRLQAQGDPIPGLLQALQDCELNLQRRHIIKEIIS
ncbi:uncharacterized protein LOC127004688 [Eriocheir sinensis]|uniref:uncharacterized protein LOC126991959 n=1 Tax=Eriocheir sinensis TaxID=95602 RepID=UPI0021C71BA1|nr:uncharacterized protein LOC126991959 [Eriocheir sinensis]XP_050728734.1 uncharacterized protein LOC127004688 [Eriocheir sinensis]UIS31341.1 Fas-associated death domain protein [Eriocheir sinensis]